VARSSSDRPGDDEPDVDEAGTTTPEAGTSADSDAQTDADADDTAGNGADDPEGDIARTTSTDRFWAKARIEPIELALPGGVGYTLRAYPMSTDITPSDYSAREVDEFPDRSATYTSDAEPDAIDEAELAAQAGFPDEPDADTDADADVDADEDELEAEAADDDDDDDEPVEEEVPLFLSKDGRLLLFRTRAGLVDFVQSEATHDLTQLPGWSDMCRDLVPERVVAAEGDAYDLDLVVKNLRAGHAAWDADMLVRAGQVARDLGHALHIEPVMLAMSPGSPLDDLDEALRGVASGGMGSFFARRKMKKIGAETASLGWRTVIGKISAVVDWRD